MNITTLLKVQAAAIHATLQDELSADGETVEGITWTGETKQHGGETWFGFKTPNSLDGTTWLTGRTHRGMLVNKQTDDFRFILTPAQQQATEALAAFQALAPGADAAPVLEALQAAEDALHSTNMWFTTYAGQVAEAIRKLK